MNTTRMIRIVRRLLTGSCGALILLALALGCGDDTPTGSVHDYKDTDDGDTTVVSFEQLTWTAYDADGTVQTGLELQWRISFASTTGRHLKIIRYQLFDDSGATVLDRTPHFELIATQDQIISDKERWIPIDGPTAFATYRFEVQYESGHLLVNADDQSRWVGPFGSGTLDSTFTAIDP